ncbi:MAG: hypothetical protein EXR27_00835 [Betaproteobacteria bacterium]|nr:hypothetical protein [Betaproteobacteria bacterium]
MNLSAKLIESGKLKAFLIHLALSAAVVGAFGLAAFTTWYPPPWFMNDGGWQVLRIIVMADVVLGPLLTLVVFRRGKPELRRDLGIIAALQLAALVYGASLMVQHRPAFVVYVENNFFTVTWPEIEKTTRDLNRLRQFKQTGAGLPFVRVALPADLQERNQLRTAMRDSGSLITGLGDRYEAITPAQWEGIYRLGTSIESLAKQDPVIARDLERVMRTHGLPIDQLAFVPVTCRYGVVVAVFRRNSRELIDWMT